MRSSKIIRKEEADLGVLFYEPPRVAVDVQSQSKNFIALQKIEEQESFKVNKLVADQIGLAAAEVKVQERKIEDKALEKMQEVQERAFKEAYELGLFEGKQKAYDDYQDLIRQQLERFSELMEALATIKKNVLDQNESQMVDLIYYMAKKVALEHIQSNPARIIPVLREVVETMSEDERVTVRISTADYAFVEELRKEMKREFEFLKKITLAESTDVKDGGCIFETKNGLKDASVEERLEKLWKVLQENKPKTKTDGGQ